MKKHNFSAAATKAQHTELSNPKSRIMEKLHKESHAFRCSEFDFDRCLADHYVQHHMDELLGLVECSDEVFYRHHGNQPVFYFTMTWEPGNGSHWNGMLHFTSTDIEGTRKYIQKRAKVIDVVVAYEDPFTGLYHFIIDTHAEDLSDDNFRTTRKKIRKGLDKHIKDLRTYSFNFYVRALPQEKFDILNREALFGSSELLETQRSCKTMQVGDVINKIFGKIFKTA